MISGGGGTGSPSQYPLLPQLPPPPHLMAGTSASNTSTMTLRHLQQHAQMGPSSNAMSMEHHRCPASTSPSSATICSSMSDECCQQCSPPPPPPPNQPMLMSSSGRVAG